MKKAVWVLMVMALAGCGDQAGTKGISSQPAEVQEAEVVQPVKAEHQYSVEDGGEYGYERGVSQNDQESGTAANSLLMFRYAGQHDGKYQAYHKDGSVVIAMECGNPCDFIKVMTFYDGELIKKEMLRATGGMIGWSVMADAINGFLKPYVAGKQGKEYQLTFDEKRGIQKVPVAVP